MLKLAAVFFIIAVIAGIIGLLGVAFEIAKIFFYIFLVLFAIALVAGLVITKRLRD